MKKTIITIAMALVAVSAGAQSMYDALNFGQNNYYGTARSIAMGNAMTAVGGDLGSIGINPAGSAVNGYSQFTITPNVSVGTSNSTYYAIAGGAAGNSFSDSYSRFTMPNLGAVVNIDLGNRNGFKRMSVGFVSNVVNDYTGSAYAAGRNNTTSIAGAFAAASEGYEANELNQNSAWDRSTLPWNSILAYKSGMMATYGGLSNSYLGSTEKLYDDGTIGVAGDLDQRFGRKTYGTKYDMVMNVGFDYSDFLWFGFNLGITSINYNYNDYLRESAVNTSDFGLEFTNGDVAYLDNLKYQYSYRATGAGVYLKAGFIARPVAGFRIGAAIQTPTALEITETWQSSGRTNFTNSKYSCSATSPKGEYTYVCRTPYRIDFGLAYSALNMILVSADYEMANYSTMKFREVDNIDNSYFVDANSDIKDYTGVSQMLRLGAEFKPLAQCAIRAGYTLTTSPEYYYDNGTKTPTDGNTRSYSFGLGYSSNGSFFADVAYRYNTGATMYLAPYADYIDDTYSPEVVYKHATSNIVATVGWRF